MYYLEDIKYSGQAINGDNGGYISARIGTISLKSLFSDLSLAGFESWNISGNTGYTSAPQYRINKKFWDLLPVDIEHSHLNGSVQHEECDKEKLLYILKTILENPQGSEIYIKDDYNPNSREYYSIVPLPNKHFSVTYYFEE